MLVNLKEILSIAERDGSAVGSFNATNLESLYAVISAAEELNVPVIVAHAEVHNFLHDVSVIGPAMVLAAQRSRVPVCVHLDHGVSLEMIYKALRYGFTSVMIDASAKGYEENVGTTRRVTEIAHALGVSVEAELGRVMTLENGEPIAASGSPRDYYTRPEEAAEFAAKTGVDALAIAFGTSHGFYREKPELDFGVIGGVRRATGLPLVMHGGSGVSCEGYRRSIAAGIRKINYYSYMAGAGYEAAERLIAGGTTHYYHDVAQAAGEAMRENALAAMRIFLGK